MKNTLFTSAASQDPVDRKRRRAIVGVVASAGTVAANSAIGQATSCILTPDAGEGPFYFDPDLLRADITDTMPGAPLDLALKITRAGDCTLLPRARVDVWHADGIGLYSGYENQPGVGTSTESAVNKSYLRGTQFTDDSGWVRFRTIFPSWYGGRTPHVHFKVLLDGSEVLASQVFFPDEVSRSVFAAWSPYREYVDRRTVFNTNDPLFDGVLSEVQRNDQTGVAAAATVTVEI
jgi:protocatechuate 3,4-dioxygenase beta subunit